ncbi:hypothetical protein NYZ99_14130 [Maribacter litopenaei]|uniref:Uncharacterized protein n=1 Tax=Maribacter litopenaei TaxID=2976127 RepID=A0ABY5Y554_9FLAO|nr:hypothetical protein [Maribacter litopenaei]UWX54145.1 hypothetical protein NYZ99_14130 [Maribacter litopenaei]
MKRLFILSIFTSLVHISISAQIKIGDNPRTIDPSSLLELESNSRVLVITRVSTAQMESIVPQRGGMVYNTDRECIHYYDGSQWINLCDAVSFSITNDPIENLRSTIAITQTPNSYNRKWPPIAFAVNKLWTKALMGSICRTIPLAGTNWEMLPLGLMNWPQNP